MDRATFKALKTIVSVTRYIYEDEEPKGAVMRDVRRLEDWIGKNDTASNNYEEEEQSERARVPQQ
jgi:hypothetical protein